MEAWRERCGRWNLFEKGHETLYERWAHEPTASLLDGPGYKWGPRTKVLALYVRDLVLCGRYFPDGDVERIAPWLYCPVDSVVMKRLRELGEQPGVYHISRIDSPARFWRIQDLLGVAATRAGVPRVWFDANWGDRDRDAGRGDPRPVPSRTP